MNRISTILLYVVVLLISTFCAAMSQKRRIYNEKVEYYFRLNWFFLSFLVACFFCACTNIGVDYQNYVAIIRRAEFDNLFSGEVGLNLLFLMLKVFLSENTDGVIFVSKTLAMAIAYYAIYRVRNKVNLGLAVFAYMFLSYLRFFLIGMHLSTALILLSLVYLVEDNNKRAWGSYLIGCTIHYSAILLFPAYLLFYVITIFKKKISKLMIGLLSVSYLVAMLFVSSIYRLVTSNISFLSHYAEHGIINDYQGTGLMQIVFFLPIVYFGWQIYKKHNNVRLINTVLIFGLTSFLFAMLGYSLNVISRMYEHFVGLYIVLIPMFLFDRKNSRHLHSNRYIFSYKIDAFIWVCCVCLRGIDVWVDIFKVTSSANMSTWQFFWPF